MLRTELRAYRIEEMRLADSGSGPKKLVGYAALFNSASEDLGGFTETIARGAFKESLKTDDQRALWNHNTDFVLGRKSAGTLSLREDRAGLAIEITPPDTQWARDFMVSVERGDVGEMSFKFQTVEDKWETKDGKDLRTLKQVRLFEVSPVTFAAYPETDVALRSLEAWHEGLRPDEWIVDAARRQRMAEAELT